MTPSYVGAAVMEAAVVYAWLVFAASVLVVGKQQLAETGVSKYGQSSSS
jgi:hypothetical protein